LLYREHMRFLQQKLSAQQVVVFALAALLVFAFMKPRDLQAQRNQPAVAQVGPGSPLPVYVVNDPKPALPENFTPGTSWKFTTWTIPSTLTFTATVQKVSGPWALLKVTSNAQSTSSWYYVPQMPGTWEQQ